MRGALSTKGLFDPTTVVVRVHGELVKTPYQQCWNDEPLNEGQRRDEGGAEPRGFRGDQSKSRIEEIVAAQDQRESESTGAAADVKGQGDGEDYAE